MVGIVRIATVRRVRRSVQEVLAGEAFDVLWQGGSGRSLQVAPATQDDIGDGRQIHPGTELGHQPLGDIRNGDNVPTVLFPAHHHRDPSR
jgi:hypothetical protein